MNEKDLLSLFRIGISIHNFNKASERETGLSLVQWCLLKKLIDLPAVSALVLAKNVGVHPSTLTQTLKRLEKKAFIFITEDPTDSRKKLVALTRKGQFALKEADSKMLGQSQNFAGIKADIFNMQQTLRPKKS